MNEPSQYFIDLFRLKLPGGLNYYVMCNWEGEIEATFSVAANHIEKLDFLLKLLDFVEVKQHG
ncbi:MAG: hypothetical protein QW334_00130 [Thermofilum sp.]